MKRRVVSIAAALAIAPASAWADPGSLVVALFELVGTAATIAALATNLLVGAALTSRAKKKARRARARQTADYNANLQDRTGNIISPVGPKKTIYGEPAPSGVSIVDSFHSGARDEFLHLVCVWTNHSCGSIDEVYLEGVPVGPLDANGWCTQGEFYENRGDKTATAYISFDASGLAAKPSDLLSVVAAVIDFGDQGVITIAVSVAGANLAGPPNTSATVTYTYSDGLARVNIQKHLGAGIDTADAFLIAARPDLWTVDHKISGSAYIVLTLSLDFPRLQGGGGEITMKGKGKNDIYDFVTATSGYTTNAVRCAFDYLRSPAGGSVALNQLDGSWLVQQQIAEQIAYPAPSLPPSPAFEDWLMRTGGDAKRFVCHGVVLADAQRENVIEAFESAFSGQIADSAGVWRVRTGVWSTPVLTITDDDRRGSIEQIRGGSQGSSVFNSSRVTYAPHNAIGGKAVPAPLFVNTALLAADGRERNAQVDATFIASAQHLKQAQRIKVERSRGGQIIRYPGDLRLLSAQAGDLVIANDSDWQIVNKTYRVIDGGFSLDSARILELEEDIAAYYDQADDATGLDPANTDLPDALARPPAPDLLPPDSGDALLSIAPDGTVISAVRVSWTLPVAGYVIGGGRTEVQWKLASSVADTWVTVPAVPGNTTNAKITPAPDGQVIIIRVRHVSLRGVPSLWATISHFVIGKTAPPSDVVGLQITTRADGHYAVWDSPADTDYFQTWVRKGVNWSNAVTLGSAVSEVRRNATSYPLGWLAAGLTSIVAKHLDSSNNQSLTAASASITIIPPAQPVYAAYNTVQDTLRLTWGDVTKSQPIVQHEMRVGPTNGTFATAVDYSRPGGDERERELTFSVPGLKRIYHRAKDAAGNWGAIAITEFSTSLPAGFAFESAGFDDFFGGSFVNAGMIDLYPLPRYIYMLIKQETWDQHMAQYTPKTMRAKELAGYAIHSSPGATTASYTKTIDAGKILAAANLQWTRQTQWRNGTGTLTPVLLYKLNAGDAWTEISNTWAAQLSNFRYFGIRLEAAATPAGAKLIVQSLSYQLSTQTEEETGTLNCLASDSQGTLYLCTKPFIDIIGVQATTSADGTWATVVSDDTVSPVRIRVKIWRVVAGAEVRQNGAVNFSVKGLV